MLKEHKHLLGKHKEFSPQTPPSPKSFKNMSNSLTLGYHKNLEMVFEFVCSITFLLEIKLQVEYIRKFFLQSDEIYTLCDCTMTLCKFCILLYVSLFIIVILWVSASFELLILDNNLNTFNWYQIWKEKIVFTNYVVLWQHKICCTCELKMVFILYINTFYAPPRLEW